MNDQELLQANAHIPTPEIERDILETEAEIVQMEREADHLEQTPMSLQSARMDHIRASSRRTGIADRKQFVETLKRILELRKAVSR